MSAGDVLFVGWTGGTPNYKEMPASYQIEPAEDTEYIRKRVQISRICFQKDEQAVIQSLPIGDREIVSAYIDTDGSAKTKSFGSGFTLLNVSRADQALGFSRITAVYEKTVHKIFEIGLPDGLSVECSQGKAQIKYNDNVLEEIDSGDGVCLQGLEFDIYQAWIGDFFTPQEFSTVIINPPSANYRPFYGADLKINNKVVERNLLFGKDVPQREFVKSNRQFTHDFKTFRQGGDPESINISQILADRQTFIDENRLSQTELNEISALYRDKYLGDQYTQLSVSVNQDIDWDIVTTPKTVIETETVQVESVAYNVQAVATGIEFFATTDALVLPPDSGQLNRITPSQIENTNQIPPQLIYENVDPTTFEFADYYTGPFELRTNPFTKQISSTAILYKAELVEVPTTVTEYIEKEITKTAAIFYGVDYTTIAKIEATFNLPARGYVPKMRWDKTGNVIKLLFGNMTIREYDVTGLT